MGCSSSKSSKLPAEPEDAEPRPVPTDRRRLSVDGIEAPPPTLPEAEATQTAEAPLETVEEPEKDTENANLIQAENEQSGPPIARRWSLGTMTDQGREAFANKSTELDGDENDPASSGLGFACKKGYKPESPNQDSFAILKVEGDFSIYGVYDGHGQKGHDVSNYVKDLMPKLITADQRFKTDDMSAMFVDIFRQSQDLIMSADQDKTLSAQMSGTTATVIVHNHAEKKITVSHVADSTAVLARYTDSSKNNLQAIQLTRDHKPDLPDEKARIEAAGGRVVFDGYSNHRVYAKNARYPGLNMSRCLGDLLGHADAGCSCVPEVNTLTLVPEDHMLLLCSDGVWEFISPQSAVDIVKEYGPGMAMKAAEQLAQEAWNWWIKEEDGQIVDDITVLLVYLQQDEMK